MSKLRVDILMMQRGLAESQTQAQRLVMAGQVRMEGQIVLKPSDQVNTEANLQVDHGPMFVSRGGEKLQAALLAFSIDVTGLICADVGASTGGFTDCLLQHGARKVYAIDVGYGVLHWKLRNLPQVVVMERTNARYLLALPEPVSMATIDASFISLKILLPAVKGWFPPQGGNVVVLIKPQFEVGREEAQRGEGVIRDRHVHQQVLIDVLGSALQQGYILKGLITSPLRGPKGNTEFLALLSYGTSDASLAVEDAIRGVLPEILQD
jgi:23S rRNA (cytidine1920-2'-O)/16S rRNA (cytidine1409-2'-O)-methyltransferase